METTNTKKRLAKLLILFTAICAGIIITRHHPHIPVASVIVTKVRLEPYHSTGEVGQVIYVDLKNTGTVPVFNVMVFIDLQLSEGRSGGGFRYVAYSGTKGIAPGENYIAQLRDGYKYIWGGINEPAYSGKATIDYFTKSCWEGH